MQERYLGDVHDFLKYAFIKHIYRETNFCLGLNWYLSDPNIVDPIDNNDGEVRYHLKNERWKNWDDSLFIQLQKFSAPSNRTLKQFYKLNILPAETVYFDQWVPCNGRTKWHKRAINKLKLTDHVFLDPDNGAEIKSMTRRTSAKYILFDEIKDYIDSGIAVTFSQFARQYSPQKRAQEVLDLCLDKLDYCCSLPTLFNHVSPSLLFVSLAPPHKADLLKHSVMTFALNSPKMNNVSSQVTLIE